MSNRKWQNVRMCVKEFQTIIAGGLISIIIFLAQYCQTEKLADSNQKLTILQIFSEKLKSNENVYEKQMVFKLLDNLEDKNLAESLKKISDLSFIDFYKDSIWSELPIQRENVIQEFARIYKRLPNEVLSTIKEEATPSKLGDKSIKDYIDNWNLTISVTKFFYYIDNYGYGNWEGTKNDSIFFANFRNSKYYLFPDKAPTPNIRQYVEIMLKNFKRIKT